MHMIPSMISCCYQRGVAVKLEDVFSICLTFTPLVLAHFAQFLHVKYLKVFYTSHSLQYSTFRQLKVSIHRHISCMQCFKITEHVLAFMPEYYCVFKEDITYTQHKDGPFENVV